MTVGRLSRLVLGLVFLYGAYELFDAAADELGSLLGELFAEAVISTDNVTGGNDNAA